MPYIHIVTNESVSDSAAQVIKAGLGQAISAIPGKTEQWLMVSLTPEAMLWFAGSDEPAAMVDISFYGGADSESYDTLTGRVSDILQSALALCPERIYVKYSATPDWGWNSHNF
ncbi:MAG: phenylpyruvate tautomerase MIF-related protein [Ruthenibacterium sp.]